MPDEANQEIVADPKTKGRKKFAVWISCALWGLSILLSFSIPTSSNLIWLPDTVLLLGFFPLIWICPFSLVWIAFGLLTAFIGSFLLLLINIPDSALPAATLPVKKHLAEFHPWWSWLLIGVLVTICGAMRMLINIVRHFARKNKSINSAPLDETTPT